MRNSSTPSRMTDALAIRTALCRLAPVLLFVFLGTDCASLNLQKPTASVSGMAVQDLNPQGFTMNFNVDVSNPNSVALPLGQADYKVNVSGADLVNGSAQPGGSLPARGTRSFVLPVAVSFENLLNAGQAIRASGGDMPYDLSGGLTFNSGVPVLGPLRVPLDFHGTLPLAQFLKDPKILLQSDTARKLAALLLRSRMSGQ